MGSADKKYLRKKFQGYKVYWSRPSFFSTRGTTQRTTQKAVGQAMIHDLSHRTTFKPEFTVTTTNITMPVTVPATTIWRSVGRPRVRKREARQRPANFSRPIIVLPTIHNRDPNASPEEAAKDQTVKVVLGE